MLSVACGMEHTLALCSDGVGLTDCLLTHLLQRRPEFRIQTNLKGHVEKQVVPHDNTAQ